MFPRARVNVFVYNQVVAMPAMIVLGLWIVLQLFSGFGSIAATSETTDQGGVAYMRMSAGSWPTWQSLFSFVAVGTVCGLARRA
jgi:membrane associated rhomboid family serine protease